MKLEAWAAIRFGSLFLIWIAMPEEFKWIILGTMILYLLKWELIGISMVEVRE